MRLQQTLRVKTSIALKQVALMKHGRLLEQLQTLCLLVKQLFEQPPSVVTLVVVSVMYEKQVVLVQCYR